MTSVMSDDIGGVNLTGSMSSVFMSVDTQVCLCAEPAVGCGAADAASLKRALRAPLNPPASIIIVRGGCFTLPDPTYLSITIPGTSWDHFFAWLLLLHWIYCIAWTFWHPSTQPVKQNKLYYYVGVYIWFFLLYVDVLTAFSTCEVDGPPIHI